MSSKLLHIATDHIIAKAAKLLPSLFPLLLVMLWWSSKLSAILAGDILLNFEPPNMAPSEAMISLSWITEWLSREDAKFLKAQMQLHEIFVGRNVTLIADHVPELPAGYRDLWQTFTEIQNQSDQWKAAKSKLKMVNPFAAKLGQIYRPKLFQLTNQYAARVSSFNNQLPEYLKRFEYIFKWDELRNESLRNQGEIEKLRSNLEELGQTKAERKRLKDELRARESEIQRYKDEAQRRKKEEQIPQFEIEKAKNEQLKMKQMRAKELESEKQNLRSELEQAEEEEKARRIAADESDEQSEKAKKKNQKLQKNFNNFDIRLQKSMGAKLPKFKTLANMFQANIMSKNVTNDIGTNVTETSNAANLKVKMINLMRSKTRIISIGLLIGIIGFGSLFILISRFSSTLFSPPIGLKPKNDDQTSKNLFFLRFPIFSSSIIVLVVIVVTILYYYLYCKRKKVYSQKIEQAANGSSDCFGVESQAKIAKPFTSISTNNNNNNNNDNNNNLIAKKQNHNKNRVVVKKAFRTAINSKNKNRIKNI